MPTPPLPSSPPSHRHKLMNRNHSFSNTFPTPTISNTFGGFPARRTKTFAYRFSFFVFFLLGAEGSTPLTLHGHWGPTGDRGNRNRRKLNEGATVTAQQCGETAQLRRCKSDKPHKTSTTTLNCPLF